MMSNSERNELKSSRPPARLADYVAMARPDHWVKHVFVLPGVALATILNAQSTRGLLLPLLIGLVSAAAVASANYVLNEWLDARFDAFHPSKSSRPAVVKHLSGRIVTAEYLLLAGAGLGLAFLLSTLFLLTSVAFLVSGLIYNVPPIRTKDRVYLDVLSESFNNPIRLTLGWAIVDSSTLPPSSLLLAYWMGGAFLMGVKRFAEYRTVREQSGLDALHNYRKSFAVYSESSLMVSIFVYSQMAAFFVAVFLIKYRIEYLLSLPVFAALFGAYLGVGLQRESSAQAPEKLLREGRLVLLVFLLVLALAVLTWVDIPILEKLSDPHFIHLSD